MALGRLFQRHGAATENALSPSVLSVLIFGRLRRRSPLFLKLYLDRDLTVSSSEIYSGARPFRALKVMSNILKLILKLTGSQCKLIRTGVM